MLGVADGPVCMPDAIFDSHNQACAGECPLTTCNVNATCYNVLLERQMAIELQEPGDIRAIISVRMDGIMISPMRIHSLTAAGYSSSVSLKETSEWLQGGGWKTGADCTGSLYIQAHHINVIVLAPVRGSCVTANSPCQHRSTGRHLHPRPGAALSSSHTVTERVPIHNTLSLPLMQ